MAGITSHPSDSFVALASSLVEVFDTFPVGVAVAFDADLQTVRINAVLREMLGVNSGVVDVHTPAHFQRWRRDVEASLDQLPMLRAVRGGVSVPAEAFDIVRDDGSRRHVLASAAPLRDQSGTVRGGLGVYVDQTGLVDAAAALRSTEEFTRQVLASSQDCIKVLGLDGRLLSITENGRKALAIEDFETVKDHSWLEFWSGDDRAAAEAALAEARAGGVGRFVGYFATLRGEPRWWDIVISPMLDGAGRPERLLAVSRDITERRRAEASTRLLSAAGATLNASLSAERTLQALAQLSVETVADYCFVDVLEDGRRLRRVAWEHRNPARRAQLEASLAFVPPLSADAHPAVAGTAGPVLVVECDQAWRDAVSLGPAHREFLQAFDVTSLIVVPVRAHGDLLGTLAFGLTAEHSGARRYAAEDVAVAVELAARAGIALDNARRFEREHRVAESLQRAALPRALPRVPGLAFDAVYQPGRSEAEIGGDWYDAFVLGDGRIGISIGDVTGKGLDAAVIMGRLRQTIRAAAIANPAPLAVLDTADAILRADDPGALATAFFGVLDVRRGALVCAAAGHPPPFVRAPDGGVAPLGVPPGLMLGLRDGGSGQTCVAPLDPGAFVVFYTDGLIESRRDIALGERRLVDAIGRESVRAALHPAAALRDAVLFDGASDDVAILTLALAAPV